jgi:hypothetical protein
MRRAAAPDASDLTRFADGRVWRLKKGRDFQGSPRAFRETARAEASRMGKTVVVVADKLQRDRWVWLQFADGAIDVGDRCVCGSRDLERLHRHWARCRACGRLLDINNPDHQPGGGDAAAEPFDAAPDAPQPPRTVKGLDAFGNLTLYRFGIDEDVEHCLGVGNRGTARILVSVKFPLEDGRRIPDPGTPGHWLYSFAKASLEEFGGLLDVANLEDRTPVSWRIDEDPGPEPHADFEEPPPN